MGDWRNAGAVISGKACALYVLLMSLSGRISEVTGYEYFQYPSFAFCAVVAIVFTLLIPRIGTDNARRAFAITSFLLGALWCVLLGTLLVVKEPGEEVLTVLTIAVGLIGRLATLFINIQWNFFFSLNLPGRAAKYTSATVLLSLALFILSNLVAPHTALVFVLVALIVSAVLNIVLIGTARNARLVNDMLKSLSDSDKQQSISSKSIPKTRLLYFGARVLYGGTLGFLVCLIYAGSIANTSTPLYMLFSLVGCILLFGGVLSLYPGSFGSLYFLVTTPIFALVMIAIGFSGGSASGVAALCAIAVELAWSTQNLFQLPIYRRMTAINPSTFAYYEYAAQIIPFYLLVVVLKPAAEVISSTGLTLYFALGTALVLVGFSIGALIRHILNYQPNASADMPVVSGESDRDRLAKLFDQLTPRECDVLALLANGYSGPYIAKTLYLAAGTVKTHVRHIYAKLSVGSQDELIDLVSRSMKR